MKWANVERQDLNTAIEYIKVNHDPETVRKIIEYFHERMSNGDPYDRDMLHMFMAHVFDRMVNGEVMKNGKVAKLTADQAFGLRLRKGQGNIKDTLDRDLKAAAYMVLLMRKGMLWQDAKGHAANRLFPDGEGEKAVERAYEEHCDLVESFPDEVLEVLAPPSLP